MKRADGYIDYEDLTPAQQLQAREWISSVKLFAHDPKACEHMAFKLRQGGFSISRRHSDRTLSTAWSIELEERFGPKPTRRANDDITSGGVH